jgi:uncharacterized protein YkwD
MEVSTRQDRGRSVAAAAAGALVLATGLLFVPAAAEAEAATQCANAGAHPDEATLAQLKRAIVCLINEKRATRGKPRLDPNGKLNDAAVGHTETMLAEDCFEQQCPGEPDFSARVEASGYPAGAERWKGGENLGCSPTPRRMLRAWMHQRFSRRNILKTDFRDIGVGPRRGAPASKKGCQPGAAFVTYTVILAWRRR